MCIKTVLMVLAGGSSNRFGNTDKLYRPLRGMPLLYVTLLRMGRVCPEFPILVVLNKACVAQYERIVSDLPQDIRSNLLPFAIGGVLRQDSVRHGLKALSKLQPIYVSVHDAARVNADWLWLQSALNELHNRANVYGVCPVVRVSDMLVDVIGGDMLEYSRTDISAMYGVQTPQVFRFDKLKWAHRLMEQKKLFTFRDDGSLLQAAFPDRHVIVGLPMRAGNIKVTYQEDWDTMSCAMRGYLENIDGGIMSKEASKEGCCGGGETKSNTMSKEASKEGCCGGETKSNTMSKEASKEGCCGGGETKSNTMSKEASKEGCCGGETKSNTMSKEASKEGCCGGETKSNTMSKEASKEGCCGGETKSNTMSKEASKEGCCGGGDENGACWEYHSAIGYDIHKLVQGGPLKLCGVNVDVDQRLSGHSDGDAALHALIDALLNLTCDGDIGMHFPAKEEYKDIDSGILLSRTWGRFKKAGHKLLSVHMVIICQKPRLSGYRDVMRKYICDALCLGANRVNVQFKTNDKLDDIGQCMGIVAYANVNAKMCMSST